MLQISTEEKITDLLCCPPQTRMLESNLHQEQRKNPKLAVFINYLEDGVLPQDEKEARKTAALATKLSSWTKCCILSTTRRQQAAVPSHNCYRNITEAEWLDIFWVTVYMPRFIIIGGGKTCLLMLSPFVGTMLSVLWLLVWEERNGHHCI